MTQLRLKARLQGPRRTGCVGGRLLLPELHLRVCEFNLERVELHLKLLNAQLEGEEIHLEGAEGQFGPCGNHTRVQSKFDSQNVKAAETVPTNLNSNCKRYHALTADLERHRLVPPFVVPQAAACV